MHLGSRARDLFPACQRPEFYHRRVEEFARAAKHQLPVVALNSHRGEAHLFHLVDHRARFGKGGGISAQTGQRVVAPQTHQHIPEHVEQLDPGPVQRRGHAHLGPGPGHTHQIGKKLVGSGQIRQAHVG